MNLKITLTLISVNLLFACAPTDQVSSSGRSNGSGGSHPDESALLWQQTSAEYDALCYQAFNAAETWLRLRYNDPVKESEKRRAIIMDLDETILDNSAYNAYLVINNEKHSNEKWAEWVRKVKAKAVPGAVEFLVLLMNYDIDVFFISNRSRDLEEFTLKNLRALGINADESQLLLMDGGQKSKTERREQVISEYDVIMLFGDNLADFDDLFDTELNVTNRERLAFDNKNRFGKKFIVFPNPVYGDWKKSLQMEDPEFPKSDRIKSNKPYLRTEP